MTAPKSSSVLVDGELKAVLRRAIAAELDSLITMDPEDLVENTVALTNAVMTALDLELVGEDEAPEPLADTGAVRVLAWREGARVRGESGAGYGDAVPDEAIAGHVQQDLAAGLYRGAAFAAAVLHLRAREREEPRP